MDFLFNLLKRCSDVSDCQRLQLIRLSKKFNLSGCVKTVNDLLVLSQLATLGKLSHVSLMHLSHAHNKVVLCTTTGECILDVMAQFKHLCR